MSFLENPAAIVADPQSPGAGRITLVGAGPGAPDLLTLRAIRCLQQADIVFYDRLVDPEALAFAPASAQRVFVGKEVGAHSWPQPRINQAIVAAALRGLRVVRLKSGDPSVFGRAAEEIAAAHAHGIAVEVIPGITAALAAAASICQPLTERGVTDRLVLATATCRPGEEMSDIADLARPGTALVFYMAMHRLDELAAKLAAQGVAPGHPVTVAANVAQPSARALRTTLAGMAGDCAAAGVRNPAVVMLTLPKLGATGTPDAGLVETSLGAGAPG
jgi:uroporphyrin-III C-methyltransferase